MGQSPGCRECRGNRHRAELGLTCDPLAGLVQVPCIERDAIALVTAAPAAGMALHTDGSHKASLDQVVKTMRYTVAT